MLGAPRAGDAFTPGLVTVTSPRSAAAEAYRLLRTNLEFVGLDKPVQTLLVTSAGPRDGKTTVVANLAVVLADAGQRVIVIDADLRQPRLHEVFGAQRSPGFSDALLDERANPPLQSGPLPTLRLLSAGTPPPNPAELLASARVSRLLDRLKGEADIVLLDSPPLAAVSDATILATRVDGVLLVVSARRTRRDLAQRAREQLKTAGARVVGAVLNNAAIDKEMARYYTGH
ncbi:MAG: CpsD/CapB family tyrosine-protein kinase [Chloroflexi bacterium]|nr:CpsD/CapB family tyrosine-protein kinase [Chloroflexota bacterium]